MHINISDLPDFEQKARLRRVATPAGVRQYGQPLGSIIVPDVLPGLSMGFRDVVGLLESGKYGEGGRTMSHWLKETAKEYKGGDENQFYLANWKRIIKFVASDMEWEDGDNKTRANKFRKEISKVSDEDAIAWGRHHTPVGRHKKLDAASKRWKPAPKAEKPQKPVSVPKRPASVPKRTDPAIAEGDRIRYHQAPGGLMAPSKKLVDGKWTIWTEGVAARKPGLSSDPDELFLRDEKGRYYGLKGHVVEKIGGSAAPEIAKKVSRVPVAEKDAAITDLVALYRIWDTMHSEMPGDLKMKNNIGLPLLHLMSMAALMHRAKLDGDDNMLEDLALHASKHLRAQYAQRARNIIESENPKITQSMKDKAGLALAKLDDIDRSVSPIVRRRDARPAANLNLNGWGSGIDWNKDILANYDNTGIQKAPVVQGVAISDASNRGIVPKDAPDYVWGEDVAYTGTDSSYVEYQRKSRYPYKPKCKICGDDYKNAGYVSPQAAKNVADDHKSIGVHGKPTAPKPAANVSGRIESTPQSDEDEMIRQTFSSTDPVSVQKQMRLVGADMKKLAGLHSLDWDAQDFARLAHEFHEDMWNASRGDKQEFANELPKLQRKLGVVLKELTKFYTATRGNRNANIPNRFADKDAWAEMVSRLIHRGELSHQNANKVVSKEGDKAMKILRDKLDASLNAQKITPSSLGQSNLALMARIGRRHGQAAIFKTRGGDRLEELREVGEKFQSVMRRGSGRSVVQVSEALLDKLGKVEEILQNEKNSMNVGTYKTFSRGAGPKEINETLKEIQEFKENLGLMLLDSEITRRKAPTFKTPGQIYAENKLSPQDFTNEAKKVTDLLTETLWDVKQKPLSFSVLQNDMANLFRGLNLLNMGVSEGFDADAKEFVRSMKLAKLDVERMLEKNQLGVTGASETSIRQRLKEALDLMRKLSIGPSTDSGTKSIPFEDMEEKKLRARKVRTAGGVKKYGQPIGSIIITDEDGKVVRVPKMGKGGSSKRRGSARPKDRARTLVRDFGKPENAEKPESAKNPKNEKNAENKPKPAPYVPIQDRPRPATRVSENIDPYRQPIGPNTLDDFKGGSAADHIVDGRFTEERAELHRKIIEKFMHGAKRPVGRQPVFNMLGGGPASGKSVFVSANQHLEKNVVTVNADEIKAELPEYNAMVKAGDESAAGFVHEESSYLAAMLNHRAMMEGVDITLDGTGDSGVDKLKGKLNAARDAGYKISGYYVTVPTDLAWERAKARGEKTGRHVHETVIRDTHQKVSAVLPLVLEEFDDIQVISTETNSNVLVLSKKRGEVATIHEPELWEKFLQKGHKS